MTNVDMTSFGNWISGEEFDAWLESSHLEASPKAVADIVWVDVESTGLDPIVDPILEYGTILTDARGRVIRNGVATWMVFDPKDWHFTHRINNLVPVVRDMHTDSGLLNDLSAIVRSPKAAEITPARVERSILSWLEHFFGPRSSDFDKKLPMSGASVHFDRAHLRMQMSGLHDWYHYRNGVDVSQLRYMMNMLNPDLARETPKQQKLHRTVPDLVDSIHLYQYAIKSFLLVNDETGIKEEVLHAAA